MKQKNKKDICLNLNFLTKPKRYSFALICDKKGYVLLHSS